MFGKKAKKEEPVVTPSYEQPDLVVQQPQHIGMPGFVEDAPVAPAPKPAPKPAPVAPEPALAIATPVAPEPKPAPKPAPVAPEPALAIPEPAPEVSVERDWYTVFAAELIKEGVYRYVITTNKPLGEVGGTYTL